VSSIWITEEGKEALIKKIQAQNEEDPLFDGGKIEELYIDEDTGTLYGEEQIGEISVNIDIPFEIWIEQFLRFDSFDTMHSIIVRREEDIKKIKKKLDEIRKSIYKRKKDL